MANSGTAERPLTGAALLASGLLATDALLVGPFTLYAFNVFEYLETFGRIVPLLLGLVVAVTLVLTLVARVLPRVLGERFVTLVFSLACMGWMQANMFVADYGLIDGQALAIEGRSGRATGELALWVLVVLVGQGLHRFLLPRIAFLSGLFLALGLVSLPFVSASGGDSVPIGNEFRSLSPVDEIHSFSDERNFLLVILDATTSDAFARVVAEQPEWGQTSFSGFTFYADALGAFPTTAFSLPVMLGIPPFRNERSVPGYRAKAMLEGDTIARRLMDVGVAVDWIGLDVFHLSQGVYTTAYAIPKTTESAAAYRRRMAAELLDLSLFRHAPHTLKEVLYSEGAWTVQPLVATTSADLLVPAASARFLAEYGGGLRLDRGSATFKILHLNGGHTPMVLDDQCNVVPQRPYDEPSYLDQVRCAVTRTAEFFDQLKASGIYDNSLIVLAADHGGHFGVAGGKTHLLSKKLVARARPLLAVKWPDGVGPLRTSHAPAWIGDIAPTIAAAAGLPERFHGRDLAQLPEDASRERAYGAYVLRDRTGDDWQTHIEEYTVSGPGLASDSWSFEQAIYAPGVDLRAEEIDVGSEQGGRHESLHGWSTPRRRPDGTTYRRATMPEASLFLDVPFDGAFDLQARISVRREVVPLTIRVDVDGTSVGEWVVKRVGTTEPELVVPAGVAGESISTITFRADRAHLHPNEEQPIAFNLDWLRVEPRGAQ